VISRDYRRARYLGRCRDGRCGPDQVSAGKGYGYARCSTQRGRRGPDASPDAVKAAIEAQRRPPQIELDKLKNI